MYSTCDVLSYFLLTFHHCIKENRLNKDIKAENDIDKCLFMNTRKSRSDLKDIEYAALTFPDWVFQSLEALRAKRPVTFSLKMGLRNS